MSRFKNNSTIPAPRRLFYAAVEKKMAAGERIPEEQDSFLTMQEVARILGCTVRGIPRYVHHQLLHYEYTEEDGLMFHQSEAVRLIQSINSVKRGWGRRMAWRRVKGGVDR